MSEQLPLSVNEPQNQSIVNPESLRDQSLNGELLKKVCRDFMHRKCQRQNCRFIHDKSLCFHFWKYGECRNEKCHKNHFVTQLSQQSNQKNTQRRKQKNTECFTPMDKPVDLRVICDLGSHNQVLTSHVTSRDVLYAPNIFDDYKPGELYKKLVQEVESCKVPKDQLLKLWHGNDKIEGTHLIANDRTNWKRDCPTFNFVIERVKSFFNMRVEATRFNWYTDTSQWKPFHHDASYIKADKGAIQNFTVAVSFGATRDAAFEHATTKTVVSMPQPDGSVYAFAKDTNAIWRHGILQDLPVRDEGRVSVICWGWIDNMESISIEN